MSSAPLKWYLPHLQLSAHLTTPGREVWGGGTVTREPFGDAVPTSTLGHGAHGFLLLPSPAPGPGIDLVNTYICSTSEISIFVDFFTKINFTYLPDNLCFQVIYLKYLIALTLSIYIIILIESGLVTLLFGLPWYLSW